MIKSDKIVIIFYVFLAISFGTAIFYIDSTYETTSLPNIIPEPVTELEITKIVGVNQEEAFLIMTDIKNYPKMLPKNIISVNIINQIDNNVLVEYEVIEHGIRTKLLTNHTMYPYDKHIVEVMDGDAKGTKLTQDFTIINTEIEKLPECDQTFDECTKIDSRVELNLKGLLSPFSYLPKRNLDHASDTVITSFTNYMQLSKSETKKIIDDLYREILQRPADTEAFEYWGSLLESEKITKIELRKSLLKSEEAISYFERFWGEIHESIYIIFHEVYEINGLYREVVDGDVTTFFVLDPRIDKFELEKMVEKNKYLLHLEEITLEELRLELEQLKENGIDFFVEDLESVNEQFLDWQKRFVDKTDDFCYVCKWGLV